QLPGPFPLHAHKTGPNSIEPGPEPEIFSSLLAGHRRQLDALGLIRPHFSGLALGASHTAATAWPERTASASVLPFLLSAPQRSPDQQEGRKGDQDKPHEDHDCPDGDQERPKQDQNRPDDEKKHRENGHGRLLYPLRL
ncbi:hypothetical protein, partial [Streptomyces sp. NPDC002758]